MALVKRIDFVVGNRPQFIKLFPIFHWFRALNIPDTEARIIHTGQHFDADMSAAFFEPLHLPKPHAQFSLSSDRASAHIPEMINHLTRQFEQDRPDAVVVLGDTNSTLAGALAASQLQIPLAHLEAGLRSYDSKMPEERNRVLVDHLSQWLFVPHEGAKKNLEQEGIPEKKNNPKPRVVICGDVMLDALLLVREQETELKKLQEIGLAVGGYYLATVHRQSNTDHTETLLGILNGMQSLAEQTGIPVVFPVHPRTRNQIQRIQKSEKDWDGIHFLSPQDYLDTQHLIMGSVAVLTDSGGLQKEACLHGKPTWVFRDRTEWNELVDLGASELSGGGFGSIERLREFFNQGPVPVPGDWYGGGNAARIFWKQFIQEMEMTE